MLVGFINFILGDGAVSVGSNQGTPGLVYRKYLISTQSRLPTQDGGDLQDSTLRALNFE
jgi:hypothetical protein